MDTRLPTFTERPRRLASGRVLLVEDDSRVRGVTARFLRHYDYIVVETADGRAALNYLREDGNVDVIVLDLHLPTMDGWTFRGVQRQDRRLSAIPVIVMSAVGDRSNQLEAVAVFEKPVSLAMLLECVRRLTEKPS
jgi:CheY-like chemotaxis protein